MKACPPRHPLVTLLVIYLKPNNLLKFRRTQENPLHEGLISPQLTREVLQCPWAHGGPRNLCLSVLHDW